MVCEWRCVSQWEACARSAQKCVRARTSALTICYDVVFLVRFSPAGFLVGSIWYVIVIFCDILVISRELVLVGFCFGRLSRD